MDAIVVDTEKSGKDCIQYLREQVCKPLGALSVVIPLEHPLYMYVPDQFWETLCHYCDINSKIETGTGNILPLLKQAGFIQ